MRRLFLSLATFVAVGVAAQDVITKRDGDEVQAKVTEITDTDVKYKKWSNPDGPTYTVKRAEVFMIKYQNGEKDVFKDEAPTAPKQTAQTPTAVDYSDKEANAAAVAAFNSFRPQYVGESGKAKYAILIFGLAENAVMEDSNISVSIANRTMVSLYFRVAVKNKTDKTVYLDLANSFVSRDEVATPYYIPSATNTTHGTSSGVGVSLGIISPILSGISVGGGSSTSTSTTVFAQRVVAIPPRSVITLEDLEFFIPTRDDSKDERMRQYDEFFGKKQATGWVNPKYSSWYLNFDEDVPLQRGEWLTYDESKSDFRFAVRISYSMTEDLAGLASVDTRMYLKHVVGIKGKSGGGKEYYDDKIVSKNFPGCDKILGIGMPIGYKKKYPYFQRP